MYNYYIHLQRPIMDNQQRILQTSINIDGISEGEPLHKKHLPTWELSYNFITELHTMSRDELRAKYSIPNMSVFNAIVLKVYTIFKYTPLPKGFVVANLYDCVDYAIREDGTVITIKTRGIVVPYEGAHGYLRVNTRHIKPHTGNLAIYERLHRLLSMTFLPLDSEFYEMQVNHINGNKLDNSLSNLEWCTQQENLTHAWETNLRAKPVNSKLTSEDVTEIREMSAKYVTVAKLAEIFNVSHTTIRDVISFRTWSNL